MAFTAVAKASQVPPGSAVSVELGGQRIAIFHLGGGSWCAIDDTCPHAGCALSEGTIDGRAVECPCHGARFHLDTGKVLEPPAEADVATYEVRLVGDDIELGQ